MAKQKETNGWHEYKRLLLSELEANKNFRTEMREMLSLLKDDVSGLKVKAALAGGFAGLVGTGLVSVVVSMWKS